MTDESIAPTPRDAPSRLRRGAACDALGAAEYGRRAVTARGCSPTASPPTPVSGTASPAASPPPGHRVVTVDQRGHGRSSKPDDGYDVATCADDLALLIDVLDLDRPAVGGQSWGGNVVLELGHRHPDARRAHRLRRRRLHRPPCSVPGLGGLRRRPRPAAPGGHPTRHDPDWLEHSAGDWPEEGRAGTLANFEVRDDGTVAPWLTFERHLPRPARPVGTHPVRGVPDDRRCPHS